MSELSPEMQLLCACCRVKPCTEDLQLQAALATQINADKLLALAIRQRVEPLLYHNLKQHALGVFPDKLMEALAARVRRNAVNSLNSIRINFQLVRLLRKHGIPFLPLKGVTLAQRYYGEIGLRHCNDIDFWVPVEHIETVRRLLLEQGCHPHHEHDIEGDIPHERLRRVRLHHIMLSNRDGVLLEIHWRLTGNSDGLLLDPAELLASGEPVTLAGETVNMMAAVPLLLYLCEHGARHGWYRLKWLSDLPQLLESRDWDWPQVLLAARRANCLGALLLGLKLAQQLFGWNLPAAITAALRQQYFLDWQVRAVCRSLSKAESVLGDPTLEHKLFRLSMVESFGYLWSELSLRWFSLYYGLRDHLAGRRANRRSTSGI